MKMVIGYVQPFMAAQVVHALHQVPGLTGATFVNVRGFGRGRSEKRELLNDGSDKVRVEVMVSDEMEEAVVQAIKSAAQTGNRGDGKIYVARIGRAVRISTGEEGEAAI